jgi:amino acid transporter
MADAHGLEPEPLERRISLLSLGVIAINGIIGAGIFGIPIDAYHLVGAFSPYMFVICALLILPIMLCFAQLSSCFSATGGPVLYGREAFGPLVGFQMGWFVYLARIAAFAANANLMVSTFNYFTSEPLSDGARIGLLFLISGFLTAINLLGAVTALRWLNAITIIKFVPLLTLAAIGLWHSDVILTVHAPLLDADFGAALLLVLYSYTGFEGTVVNAGEAINPRRDIPRALILSLCVVTAIYVTVQLASSAALQSMPQTPTSLSQISEFFMGPFGALLLTAGLVVSAGGNMMSNMFVMPRLTYRLGLDGQLPAWFSYVHPVYKTPTYSILVYGLLVFGLAASGSFVWLAGLSVLARLPVWFLCALAVLRLDHRFKNMSGAIELPRAIPVIAALGCLVLSTQAKATAFQTAGAFLLAGTIFYFLSTRLLKRKAIAPDLPLSR